MGYLNRPIFGLESGASCGLWRITAGELWDRELRLTDVVFAPVRSYSDVCNLRTYSRIARLVQLVSFFVPLPLVPKRPNQQLRNKQRPKGHQTGPQKCLSKASFWRWGFMSGNCRSACPCPQGCSSKIVLRHQWTASFQNLNRAKGCEKRTSKVARLGLAYV